MVLLKEVQDFDGELVGGDRDGVGRHKFADGAFQQVGDALEVATEIAMRENSRKRAVGVGEDGGAGAAAGHAGEDSTDVGVDGKRGNEIARAHDFGDFEQKRPPEAPAGVKPGEVFLSESARFQQDHREGVAEDQHGRGAGSGGEPERAGLFFNGGVEVNGGLPGKKGPGVARDGDERDVKAREGREDIEQFFGLAGVAQRDHYIAIGNDAEIAMQGVQGVEDDGGRARTGKGGSHFIPDMPRLSNADDDDLPFPLHGASDGFHGATEALVQPCGDPGNLCLLNLKYAFGFGQKVHKRKACYEKGASASGKQVGKLCLTGDFNSSRTVCVPLKHAYPVLPMSRTVPPDSSKPSKPLHLQIADELKRDIWCDRSPLGSHLPSEREIAARFGVAQMTVRQALSLLEGRGMIRRRHGKKTEVVSAQEKVTVGVLFGPSLTDETAYYYRALLSGMREMAPARGWELKVFDALQIRSAELHPQREAMVKMLETEVRVHGLDAVIKVAMREEDVADITPFSLPGVEVASSKESDLVQDVWLFGYEAVKRHVAHGRKKICYIRTRFANERSGPRGDVDIDGMREAAEALGIEAPTVIHLTVEVTMGASSGRLHRATVRLFEEWKKLPASERPDALIVGDDIMMRTVSMALTEAGIRTPDDVRVICATHDRADFYYIAKVQRFAFSINDVVGRMFELLEIRLQGGKEPDLPLLVQGRFIPEPVFESQIEKIYENQF